MIIKYYDERVIRANIKKWTFKNEHLRIQFFDITQRGKNKSLIDIEKAIQ